MELQFYSRTAYEKTSISNTNLYSTNRVIISLKSNSRAGCTRSGRNARPEEGESATFGNLSLVGVGGKFRIEITQRQLVISNDVRKGIKLDLGSISRTRSIDIPAVPGGVIIWGSAAFYLGATILIPPLGYAVSLLGGLSVLSHFIFKSPALVIETNIGDRHIIQSRLNDQEVLLKVHMMIEKVSNGQSVRDAKNSMERVI